MWDPEGSVLWLATCLRCEEGPLLVTIPVGKDCEVICHSARGPE